jgi:ankyrin repeat protein
MMETRKKTIFDAIEKRDIAALRQSLFVADLKQKNEDQETPIEVASQSGWWEGVTAIARSEKTDKNDKFRYGLALAFAVKSDRYETANILFDQGARTNWTLDHQGCLHWAVQNKNVNMIKLLLDHGEDETLQNKKFQTPIELAGELGHWNCAQFLIERKKNNNDQKTISDLHYEETLLHAIQQNNYAMVELLLKHGAPCWKWDCERGNIALYLAIKNNPYNPDIATLLLDHGADPNIKNKDGKTSYDLAASVDSCSFDKKGLSRNPGQGSYGEQVIKAADDLYELIRENGIKAYDLPDAIARLENYSLTILKHDLSNLKAQRETLKHKTSTTHVTQSLDPNSELRKLSLLIGAIQSLLNFPENPMPIKELDTIDLPEAKRMMVYLERKQLMRIYTENLRAYLIQLKNTLQQIPETEWIIKNISGDFVHGVPRHIKNIKPTLEKISDISSEADIYEAYRETLSAFSTESSRRHDSTIRFYRQHKNEMTSINFNVSPPNYCQAISQPTPTPTLQPMDYRCYTQPEACIDGAAPLHTLTPAFPQASYENRLYPILTGYPASVNVQVFDQAATLPRFPIEPLTEGWYLTNVTTPSAPSTQSVKPPAYRSNHTLKPLLKETLTGTSALYEELGKLPVVTDTVKLLTGNNIFASPSTSNKPLALTRADTENNRPKRLMAGSSYE